MDMYVKEQPMKGFITTHYMHQIIIRILTLLITDNYKLTASFAPWIFEEIADINLRNSLLQINEELTKTHIV